jgi:2-C-methyl-D-erythritol 4-phosphate cytidylyltransferase
MEYDDGPHAALGLVPVDGRGSMPFALLHHESLVAVASWALGEAGVELVHDPLCPGTPVAFRRVAVAVAADHGGAVVVGVRPVTDTVRTVDASGALGATVDRAELLAVASPVVIPAAVLASLEQPPDLDDLADLVVALRRDHEVTFLDAPPEARRVADESDVRLLESLLPPSG